MVQNGREDYLKWLEPHLRNPQEALFADALYSAMEDQRLTGTHHPEPAIKAIQQVCTADSALITRWVAWAVDTVEMALTGLPDHQIALHLIWTFRDFT